jgi:hypothetical protein
MVAVAGSFAISIGFYLPTTQHHISQDCKLHHYRRENPSSHTLKIKLVPSSGWKLKKKKQYKNVLCYLSKFIRRHMTRDEK